MCLAIVSECEVRRGYSEEGQHYSKLDSVLISLTALQVN
jgi:hypothetical protein